MAKPGIIHRVRIHTEKNGDANADWIKRVHKGEGQKSDLKAHEWAEREQRRRERRSKS